jgi:hypothetical protein
VDAIDGAGVNAGVVLDSDTGFGNYVSHFDSGSSTIPILSPRSSTRADRVTKPGR